MRSRLNYSIFVSNALTRMVIAYVLLNVCIPFRFSSSSFSSFNMVYNI